MIIFGFALAMLIAGGITWFVETNGHLACLFFVIGLVAMLFTHIPPLT